MTGFSAELYCLWQANCLQTTFYLTCWKWKYKLSWVCRYCRHFSERQRWVQCSKEKCHAQGEIENILPLFKKYEFSASILTTLTMMRSTWAVKMALLLRWQHFWQTITKTSTATMWKQWWKWRNWLPNTLPGDDVSKSLLKIEISASVATVSIYFVSTTI